MSSNTSRRTGPGDGHRCAIVRFVGDFAHREGHPPSLREIAGQVGLSISTISYHLSILEQDRALRRGAGRPRTIVQPADSALQTDADLVDVPLIGQIPRASRWTR
jgi:SOS-response transcriptional repressor LexA